MIRVGDIWYQKSSRIKVLFLDIDGVCNCASTTQRSRGFIGIDPYMAFMVGKIQLDTGCKVVLSSSWRHFEGGRKEVEDQVVHITDVTESEPYSVNHDQRGREIKRWLDEHPLVEKYAILDDDTDMLEEQQPNFFKTSWQTGITKEIAEAVTKHLQ